MVSGVWESEQLYDRRSVAADDDCRKRFFLVYIHLADGVARTEI